MSPHDLTSVTVTGPWVIHTQYTIDPKMSSRWRFQATFYQPMRRQKYVISRNSGASCPGNHPIGWLPQWRHTHVLQAWNPFLRLTPDPWRRHRVFCCCFFLFVWFTQRWQFKKKKEKKKRERERDCKSKRKRQKSFSFILLFFFLFFHSHTHGHWLQFFKSPIYYYYYYYYFTGIVWYENKYIHATEL